MPVKNTPVVTKRQFITLCLIKSSGGCIGSGTDGSVLRALAKKGIVIQHFNSAPSGTYYTWTIAKEFTNRTFTIK